MLLGKIVDLWPHADSSCLAFQSLGRTSFSDVDLVPNGFEKDAVH